MRPCIVPILLGALLPCLPLPSGAAPTDGIRLEGITPGARITETTPLHIQVSGEKLLYTLFIGDIPLLISNRREIDYRLNPEPLLAGKSERAAHLCLWICHQGGPSRPVARVDMDVTLAQPADKAAP